jgi:serine/threonine-protein kinase
VGATLYEVVTGRSAISGDSNWALMNGHLHETPIPPVDVNPALPRAVSDAILRAPAKNPADRFQTAAEFQAALTSVRPPSGSSITIHSTAPGTSTLNADVLRSAKKNLATFIGPIASVMVDRAARTARTPQDLYRALAEQIPDARERETFLKSSALKSTPRP